MYAISGFSLHIWDNERSKCVFYTVTKHGARTSEVEKFLEKYDALERFVQPLQELIVLLLEVIGEQYGAHDKFFNRHENEVKGLPPQGKFSMLGVVFHFPYFPLRLYALKINDQIVVLFNGGEKDDKTNQTSSFHLNWNEACKFARRIEQSIRDGTIRIIDNRLLGEDNNLEIFLH